MKMFVISGSPQRETWTSGAWPWSDAVAHPHTSSLADQRRRDLEDDRGDIPSGEEILSILKRVGMKRAFLEERGSEFAERHGVAGEQIGSEASESLHAGLGFDNAPCLARRNELSVRAVRRRRSRRTPHFKALRVSVIFVLAVGDRAKAQFERELLARVAIEIEAERVQTFLAERIRTGLTGVRVDGHGHDGEPRPPAEEIEVADVDAGILPRSRRVEVVGHSSLGQLTKGKAARRECLFASNARLLHAIADA